MPDYKFVVLKTPAERANRSARSHAMRTALQQREKEPNPSISLPYGTFNLTTPSYSDLKGRFRLSNKKKARTAQINKGSVEPMNHGGAESSEEQDRNSLNKQPTIGDGSMGLVKTKPSISTFENYSMDPFNTMPGPSSQGVDLLTKYFIHGLKLNITTVNPEKTWIGFALTDMAVFNVTLAFAAASWNTSVSIPSPWLTRAIYYHEGVAIYLVNERLNFSPRLVSDELICTVATLVNVETLSGNFDTANTHLNGLISLVEARGGIECLKETFIVERAITWVDMNLAVSYGRQPLFPPVHDRNDVYLPEDLVTLSNNSQLAGIIQPGPGTQDLLYILRLLRLIVIVRLQISETPELQNTIRVLMLRADRCILKLLMIGEIHPFVLSLVRIANSASHVLLHRALRNVPKNCLTFQILLQRLRENLERGYEHELDSAGSYIVLLWALIVGVAATYDLLEQNTWFFSRLRAEFVMFRHRYDMGRSQLEQRLNSFVWIEAMCSPVLKYLWA